METTATTMADANFSVSRAVDERLASATAVGHKRARGELATSAHYDARTRRLRIELVSGVAVSIPVSRIERLSDVSGSTVPTVRVEGGGYVLHWPSLDLDLAVSDLIAGCFGSRAWMRALARQGGKVTSAAKREASRENGRKGGRPRKP